MSDQILFEACMNNPEAVEFLQAMSRIAHTWDDLIDGDTEITKREIDSAFWDALVTLPTNSFYARNVAALHPLVITSILNWKAANALEDGNERLEIAYIIRSNYIDLALMCAYLIGGEEHATAVAPRLRMWNHAESTREYLDNLRRERQGATK